MCPVNQMQASSSLDDGPCSSHTLSSVAVLLGPKPKTAGGVIAQVLLRSLALPRGISVQVLSLFIRCWVR